MNSDRRLNKFIKSLNQYNVDAFFVSCEPNVTYLTGYTGTESFLLITKKKAFFLTDFRYVEQAKAETKGLSILLREDLGYVQMIQEVCRKEKIKRLAFESLRIPYYFYKSLSRTLKQTFLVPTTNAVEKFRIIKDSNEIKFTKKAIAISKGGIEKIGELLKPKYRETDIQAHLEYETKLLGSQKPAFDIIIAAGPNSSMPHAISGPRAVKASDMILMDMGVVFNGYHSDLTRCFFIGKIPRLKKKVYDIVKKAQELGIKKVRAGMRASDVDKACRDYITSKGYGKYFGHGTGHGVGLEIHENPSVSFRSQEVLKPGMIITVEPGIYLPGQFGVRIEDMVCVTERGCEVLTRKIKKHV